MERLRKRDIELLRELPRALLNIARADIAGDPPDAKDINCVRRYNALSGVRRQLFEQLAYTDTHADAHRVLARHLKGTR